MINDLQQKNFGTFIMNDKLVWRKCGLATVPTAFLERCIHYRTRNLLCNCT